MEYLTQLAPRLCAVIGLTSALSILPACTSQGFFESLQSTDCMEASGVPSCSAVEESLYERTPRAGMPDLHSNDALKAKAEALRN